MKITSTFKACTGILLALSLSMFGSAAYADIAGHAQFVIGTVRVTNSAGQIHDLKRGDPVHESDTLTTAKGASAQIKMRDNGLIAVRSNSQLKFDSFKFTGKEDGNERSFFSLFRGSFRAITGLIGHKNKENYRITVAGSTIGVRGTDHETYFVSPESEMASVVPVGVYNKVNSGETVITNSQGTIHILPNQMGYAASADQIPQLQPVNLNLFTLAPSLVLQNHHHDKKPKGDLKTPVMDSMIPEQNLMPGNVPPLNPSIEDRGPSAPPRVY